MIFVALSWLYMARTGLHESSVFHLPNAFSCVASQANSCFEDSQLDRGWRDSAMFGANDREKKTDSVFNLLVFTEDASFDRPSPWQSYSVRNVSAFSVDVRDLYYSLPKNLLCEEVSECIDRHGAVKFQNSCGVNVSHFLELLRFYLQSTFISHDNRLMVQKEGICIGSCLAPVLSDLLMARFDRSLMDNLDQTLTLKVFRYVDNYLIIFNLDKRHPRKLSELIFDVFKTQLQPLNLTNELPVDCKIRFLDMHFSFTPNHVCWSYEPRSKKALLPYSSAHSKLVKQGIANSCLKSALTRSCKHVVESSFLRQVDRLIDAGFPNAFIMSVAERLVRDLKKKPNVDSDQPEKKEKEKLAVIPYIHRVSHNVKRVAKKAGVKVVFSAPNKLSVLCKRVNAEGNKKPSCTKNHARKFVKCCVNVVYEIPFSPCGRCYVGQTGRCINDRLREHANTALMKSLLDKYLPVHPKTPLPPYSRQPNLKLDEDIYIYEVKAALQTIRRNTAPGVDGITNKLLANLDYDSIIELTTHLNTAWRSGQLPEDWKTAEPS
ncbi:uncharacterized protein LOC144153518 [Haemaphysalis longicornis]